MALRRALAPALGAAAARSALAGLRADAATAKALERTNFRGRPVTLAGGPALAIGASVGAAAGAADVGTAAAAAVAGLGSGAVGLYDDLVGGRPEHAAKGFRGHLTALREGRVTSGLVKIAGVGASALVAAALLPRKRPVDILLGAGVIAGAANPLGALLGTAFVARSGTAGRLAALAGLVALTAASEKVSFTQVIQRTPGLRELDELGRLKA